MTKVGSNKPRKFVIEHTDESGKVIGKWHYDLDKSPNGPVMTENFDLPRKERKSSKK